MYINRGKKDAIQTPFAIKAIIFTAGLLLGLLALRLFITPFRVSDNSMDPNFKKGDLVFVLKHVGFKLGDAVLYRTPADEDTVSLKRVIAGPADSVEVRGKDFLINGTKPAFKWSRTSKDQRILNQVLSNRDMMSKITLGKNEFFMAGDNIDMSFDSRDTGPVKKDNIIGKVIAHF